jgi:hypothetical protein
MKFTHLVLYTAITMMSCMALNPLAQAEKFKCKLPTHDVGTTVGVGDNKYDALKDAIEKCVDKRTDRLEKRDKHEVSEDRYAMFIDSCSTLSCEK